MTAVTGVAASPGAEHAVSECPLTHNSPFQKRWSLSLREVGSVKAGHKLLKEHSITHGWPGSIRSKEGYVSLELIL